jgi:hypothetical protein
MWISPRRVPIASHDPSGDTATDTADPGGAILATSRRVAAA